MSENKESIVAGETPTPRTDAVERKQPQTGRWMVTGVFARQLERELTEAQDALIEANGKIAIAENYEISQNKSLTAAQETIARLEREKAETVEDARLFGELMALMNGDGGHYQSDNGSKAAFDRAVARWEERYLRLDKAEAALREYGGHKLSCQQFHSEMNAKLRSCDCGFAEALVKSPEPSPAAPGQEKAGEWVRGEWDAEEPACVRCHATMSLREGNEWSDVPELNLCDNCSRIVLEILHAEVAALRSEIERLTKHLQLRTAEYEVMAGAVSRLQRELEELRIESKVEHSGGCDRYDGEKCNCYVSKLRRDLGEARNALRLVLVKAARVVEFSDEGSHGNAMLFVKGLIKTCNSALSTPAPQVEPEAEKPTVEQQWQSAIDSVNHQIGLSHSASAPTPTLEAMAKELEQIELAVPMKYAARIARIREDLQAVRDLPNEDTAIVDFLEKLASWDDSKQRMAINFPVPTVMHCTIREACRSAMAQTKQGAK